jgi:hypothetical protein
MQEPGAKDAAQKCFAANRLWDVVSAAKAALVKEFSQGRKRVSRRLVALATKGTKVHEGNAFAS